MIIEKSHIDQNLCYTNQQRQSCGKKMAFPRKEIKIHSWAKHEWMNAEEDITNLEIKVEYANSEQPIYIISVITSL